MSAGIYVALVFSFIAGLFFLADLNRYLKILREYRASQNWQSVLGQITSSNVNEESHSHTEEINGMSVETVTNTYFPKVEYSFDIHGETQENVRVAFGTEWVDAPAPSKEDAYDLIRHYPISAPVMVYFDPQDPSKAVLERRIVGNYIPGLVWKFLLFLAGACLVILVAYYK